MFEHELSIVLTWNYDDITSDILFINYISSNKKGKLNSVQLVIHLFPFKVEYQKSHTHKTSKLLSTFSIKRTNIRSLSSISHVYTKR